METLLLTFANNPTDPLPTLLEEENALSRALQTRARDGHFAFQKEAFVKTDDLPRQITLFQNDLVLFLFSGHAGRDRLLLSDGGAGHADGLAALLGQCPRLRLVFLNGCSTQGQVERLLAAGVPVVIATSAPVNDRAATYFSTIFFENLAQQQTLRAAFEAAKNALQFAFPAQKTAVFRDSGFVFDDSNPPEAAAWGLFFEEKNEHVFENWRLPVGGGEEQIASNFTTNQFLIDTLFEALNPYSEEVRKFQRQAQNGQQINLSKKRMAVLNALPAPLAEPLRKLMVPVEKENEGFDKISESRLRQLVQAYQTALELLAFTMIAQLWEAFYAEKSITLNPTERSLLGSLFRLTQREREAFDFVPFIRAMREVFEENNIQYFIEELRELRSLVATDQSFTEAVQFLRGLHRQAIERTFDRNALGFLCQKGEESLAYLYKNLSFMARYRLATIQGIDVKKYRHRRQPSFSHSAVMLHDLLGGFDVSTVDLPNSLDNRSILLINEETWGFLNLSPFVMDENAFHDRTEICKLFFFSHYSRSADLYFFKYVNKPDDPFLEVSTTKFGLIKEQFDAFATLLLHQPMQNL